MADKGLNRSKLAVGRLFALTVAVAGIITCILFGITSFQWDADFEEWLVARPMEIEIDLSQEEETRVSFHQTCAVSHGQGLYLEFVGADISEFDLEGALANLEGKVTILDKAEDQVAVAEFSESTASLAADGILLTQLPSFPKGEYLAKVSVSSGGRELAGREQLLYARYHLCGLEKMPGFIAGAMAVVTGLIGVCSGLGVLPGLRRYGLWRHP